MPYKDSFDHKGPLLYIINWVGNKISQQYGIWLIEMGFMTCTLFVIYKIARLASNKISHALIATFISVSLLFDFFQGGNLTEEYAMGLIAVALYIFIDYLKNRKISALRVVMCGFCFGATLLLRPNMISVWIVFCIAVFIQTVMNKEWIQLLRFIAWFATGLLAIILPIIFWLLIHEDLGQCWKDYILFNQEYSALATMKEKWSTAFFFLNSTIYITALLIITYMISSKDKLLNVSYWVYMIFTPMMIGLSGRTYGHYGMILVPIVAYPLGLLFSAIENIEMKALSKTTAMLVSIYFLSMIILPRWLELISGTPTLIVRRNEHVSETSIEIAEIIQNYVDEEEPISVYGNWDYLYVLSNRKHATRYSYQFPIDAVTPLVLEEYFSALQEELPPLIVVEAGHYDDNIKEFLDKNHYKLIWSEQEENYDGSLIYLSKSK